MTTRFNLDPASLLALAAGLGPDPDPVAAVQAWQETWED